MTRTTSTIIVLSAISIGLSIISSVGISAHEHGAPAIIPVDTKHGDSLVAEYFRRETERIADNCLANIDSLEDWKSQRSTYRRQLFEMLGMDPLPPRTPLDAVITGTSEHDSFRVENLHFQSSPGLYVTANLYLPKNADKKLPAILYVCGHGRVKQDGISYGNKVNYHHHGAWFARNGYACLTIDTIQLGELEGVHHGTYRHGMWWWLSRGYTPAGVEAWNCIRALDYLQSRPEVDPDRLGVTGRSGGGAYSWWVAALDERIKVAVPVAGITSLKNHVVDGCVEHHCDCMYHVNTYEWDFAQIAALVAPRPLLISNTDKDGIFPLDGVVDVYTKARRIYELYGQVDHIGLSIAEGPHKDTQQLRNHAFHWFNRFLKDKDPPITMVAEKIFEPEELKVFAELPADERTTTIHQTFVPAAGTPSVPLNAGQWHAQRDTWSHRIRDECFRGWPSDCPIEPSDLQTANIFSATCDNIELSAYEFTSQEPFRLRLYLLHRAGLHLKNMKHVVLCVLDDTGWTNFLAAMQVGFGRQLKDQQLPSSNEEAFRLQAEKVESQDIGIAFVAPRGIGPTAWTRDARERRHILRRFALLGQTVDGMRVWDIVCATQALANIDGLKEVPIRLHGEGVMAGNVLYAALFGAEVERLDLHRLPQSHHAGPYYLNVMRILDVPQAVAMAADECQVRLLRSQADEWIYPQSVAELLEWEDKRLQIVDGPTKRF